MATRQRIAVALARGSAARAAEQLRLLSGGQRDPETVVVCAPAVTSEAVVRLLAAARDAALPSSSLLIIPAAPGWSVAMCMQTALHAAARRTPDAVVVPSSTCSGTCIDTLAGALHSNGATAVFEARMETSQGHAVRAEDAFGHGGVVFAAGALSAAQNSGNGSDEVAASLAALIARDDPVVTVRGHDPAAGPMGIPLRDTLRLRSVRWRAALQRRGFGADGERTEYDLKDAEDSSHAIIERWMAQRPPSRVLDLGCSGGAFAQRLRARGHTVTGVDVEELPHVRERCDTFVHADLDRGIPAAVIRRAPYDVVICADVLEHVREPQRLLRQLPALLAPQGRLLVSIPNFGHWYARGRTALGMFDYDQRGLLDAGHVRFFTRRSFERLLQDTGWRAIRREVTGLPLERFLRTRSAGARVAKTLDRAATLARPTMFAYQFLYELVPVDAGVLIAPREAAA